MLKKIMKYRCCWSLTLGALEDTHQNTWGTEEYVRSFPVGEETPTVFFGLYGLPDFYALWRHKGDKEGEIKLNPEPIARWINENCESWVENETEMLILDKWGIKSKVCPSFLGDVNKFKVTYKWAKRPKVYLSVSGDEFEKYGWNIVERIADKCNVDFYLYGKRKKWKTNHKNVFVRGRVDKEVMNKEIRNMQCGLRPLGFDGCSEIIVKAGLQGQYVISKIKYPQAWSYNSDKELIKLLNKLSKQEKPNLKFRNWLLANLNKYPWNQKR